MTSTALAVTTPDLSQLRVLSPRRRSPPLAVTKPRQSRDAPILAELLELHAVARPRILDCTYGSGAIWGRLPIRRDVIKVDINPGLPGLDLACDWLELPRHFSPDALDVLVWDPIQVSDVGKSSRLYQRYVAAATSVRGGGGVIALFGPFLAAAAQVVKQRTGIVLAKMCDQVHDSGFNWQVFALVDEAKRQGWRACQYKAFFNPNPATIPGIKHQRHSRNDVAYWIVLRNGPACQGPGRLLRHELVCEACGKRFWARRSDARTCSSKCRQRLRRGGG